MRLWKSLVTVGLGGLLLAGSVWAGYDDYDDYTDSHPLRIIAYVFHPIGYTIEWLALRPLHALASQPELQPIFGTDPYGPGFSNYGITSAPEMPAPTAAAAPPTISPADLEALRQAAEAAQIAADEAKRAADEARRAADEAALSAEKSGRAFEKSLQK
ncbi:MAG TPA: hypothetical protein VKK81_02475 [Candidatus Binatia bacterium]|nr:hypothetical protein [Candidatus Binatia bacterium]